MIVCKCDAGWRRVFPGCDSRVRGATCVILAPSFAAAVHRHHYVVRRDSDGKVAPDTAAANRFACYGALAALRAKEKRTRLNSDSCFILFLLLHLDLSSPTSCSFLLSIHVDPIFRCLAWELVVGREVGGGGGDWSRLL